MTQTSASTIHRQDYLPPAWWIDRIDLAFDLEPACTTVVSTLTVRRNASSVLPRTLWLNGEDIELVSIDIDGAPAAQWRYTDQLLAIDEIPDNAKIRIVSHCHPADNTSLSGLYTSSGAFFTQCEAEGFRRITFFPDRPDIMARYRVRLVADRARFPVLLSNGNLLEQGDLPDGRHFAVWDDPFPKPSYLFALVAGALSCREQTLRTMSGRDVLLQVWVRAEDLDQTPHAMASLVESIRWDERRFGLELDLDRFMIVAVSDFNMGAMENKGLNIFNTKYVLAHPDLATDVDFAGVESVVAHEYFHNWTGNRVTCRDWFQLSLKEGLTVFRDQEFSMDMMAASADDAASARAVKRIDDVRTLRSVQFPEDAGPMAHPIRPDEYEAIDNFYTPTVYEKGAEVVRMFQTLLGVDGFRRGMDEYFRRHDGQAVTCDDFVSAMEAANGVDLTQFRQWYAQSGTPRVHASGQYDAQARTWTLTLRQSNPDQRGRARPPLHIPIQMGLLGRDGQALPLTLEGELVGATTTRLIELKTEHATLVFSGLDQAPIPSLLRGFSAPVHLDLALTTDELALLMAHDPDPFNRWEAGQRLMLDVILSHVQAGTVPTAAPAHLVQAFAQTLAAGLDPAFVEAALTPPSTAYISELVEVVDPAAIVAVRTALMATLGRALANEWENVYATTAVTGPYTPDARSAGQRALRNLALDYLIEGHVPGALERAYAQYRSACNMTDRLGALSALLRVGAAATALEDFYARFQSHALVIDKWFTLQATAPTLPDGAQRPFIEHIRILLAHPDFSLRNPNRARSVLLQFFINNPSHFHAADGSGYALWAEHVALLDPLNPQLASRVARALDNWRRYTPERRDLMRGALERVAQAPLSRDTLEVIHKALGR